MTALKVWTIIVLDDDTREKVLLLRRSSDKKLLPSLITGIGGKVELEMGEAADIEAAALRELEEETQIRREDIRDLRMRLATIITEDGLTRMLYWMTGVLQKQPESLVATEGMLEWYGKDTLPLAQMTRAAAVAVPFIFDLSDDDMTVYSGAATTKENGDWDLKVI